MKPPTDKTDSNDTNKLIPLPLSIAAIENRDNRDRDEKLRYVFGYNFRKARKAARLSQRDITKKAGYAQSFVSDVETGRVAINIDNMATLAHVVNTPLWKLLVPAP